VHVVTAGSRPDQAAGGSRARDAAPCVHCTHTQPQPTHTPPRRR
jgi:hypothetical protein